MRPLIRAASLRGFGELVTELGGDPGRLLERFGIEPEALADEDGLESITAHDQMLDAAATELGCPDLGLRLAERQDLTILGPVARAIRSSETSTDALEYAARFLFVHSPVLTIEIDDDPWGRRGVIALTYRKELAESPYSPQALSGLLRRRRQVRPARRRAAAPLYRDNNVSRWHKSSGGGCRMLE